MGRAPRVSPASSLQLQCPRACKHGMCSKQMWEHNHDNFRGKFEFTTNSFSVTETDREATTVSAMVMLKTQPVPFDHGASV